jgi:DNA-binding transcriptional LysR family regulator
MDLVTSVRIFRRVVETKSFSATAVELGVSQPTVSKAIKSLEVELAVTLLRRSTRGLSLTVEGQKLYAAGGGLIDHVERVIAEVTNQKLALSGELRLSTSLAFARIILLPLLPAFEKSHPDLRLSFVLSDGYVDLIENNIDVAVRIGDLSDSSMRAVRVGNSRRALYAARSYVKAQGRPRTVADLASHRLLYYSRVREGPTWSLVDRGGQRVKMSFTPSLQTDGSDLMREAVLNGLGIAMMPTWFMIEAERDRSVVRVFEEAQRTPSSINALTASGRELTAKQRAFIDFLRAQFEREPALSLRS